MSAPGQFLKIVIPDGARGRSEAKMDVIFGGWREDRPMAWAGLAAEEALIEAYIPSNCERMVRSGSLSYDLAILDQVRDTPIKIEVKTRAVSEGWTDPRLFEFFYVPSHDGRAPIKDVEMIFFTWFSNSEPRSLWLLGYLAGLAEFNRRAIFYREGAPLPRGGWAGRGGGWCLEIRQFRPFPAGMWRAS